MASKPVIITAALFIATIVSGVVGYAYYHSYTSLVSSLAAPPSLEEALGKVSKLSYRITSSNGTVWLAEVIVNHANKTVTAKLMDSNGTLLEEYIIGYSNNTIVSAYRVDPRTGNRTGVDIARIDGPFRTSVTILRSPTGEVGLEPFPGVGPVYALYTIGKALVVDWHGQTSPFAQVRWGIANYQFNGEKLKSIAVSIVVQPTPAPATEYNSLHAVRAVVSEKDGIIFFPEISYSTATAELLVKVTSISASG